MNWRRKWQPTPVFLRGESQGPGSLVGCRLWGRKESDTTEVPYQQQQILVLIQFPVSACSFRSFYVIPHQFHLSDSQQNPFCVFITLHMASAGPHVPALPGCVTQTEVSSLTSSLSIYRRYLPQPSLKTQNFQEFTFWLIHCFVIVLMYYFVLVLMYFSFLQLCCCCC